MKLTSRTRQSDRTPRYLDEEMLNELWRFDWKSNGYPYCGVYVVSPDNRWPSKIGISQVPSQRVAGIQTGVWRKVDVAKYGYCMSVKDARALERKVHDTMKQDGLLLYGEWFDIRPDKAFEVIEFQAMNLGVEFRTDFPDERVRDALFSHVVCQDMAGKRAEASKELRNTVKKRANFTVLPVISGRCG